jgi:hypothetical protein
MARGVAGDAQDLAIQQHPRPGMVAITLAQMRPIAAQPRGGLRVIIEDKGHIARLGDGHELLHCAGHHIGRRILQPQLQAGDIAGIKRLGQGLGKARRQARGGDEVEAAIGHG